MCWVFREAGVLKIYEYVNPIDESGPARDDITMVEGEKREFFVQPMAPLTHALKVEWYLQIVDDLSSLPSPPSEGPSNYGGGIDGSDLPRWIRGGSRGRDRRANPLPVDKPHGAKLDAINKKVRAKQKGHFFRSSPDLPHLPAGVYRLTARVWDDTRMRGAPHPWVIKDRQRLLEERRTWILRVEATKAEPEKDTGTEDESGK